MFTLFLTDPLRAFAFISDITQIDTDVWEELGYQSEQIEGLILEVLNTDESLHESYKKFLQDEFLAIFLARFIFMATLLDNHVAFKDLKVVDVKKYRPRADPPLDDKSKDAIILSSVSKLIELAGRNENYAFNQQ